MVVIILRNQVGINMLVTICEVLSRIDSFSKKECTGCTRLMRQEYGPKRRAKYLTI